MKCKDLRARRTRRPRLHAEGLEARALLTTLVALLDSGVDLNSTVDFPYYDLTLAYNAGTRQTAAAYGNQVVQDLTNNGHGHGATVADHIVRGIQDSAMAYDGGAAPAVKIMPIKLSDGLSPSYRAVIEAVYYAVDNGAKVVNLSYVYSTDIQVSDSTSPYNGKRLSDAIRYADAKGVVFTAGAGNDNTDIDATGFGNFPMPAKLDRIDTSGGTLPLPTNILTTAAVNAQTYQLYRTAKTSNWGATTVDMGAPGADGATSYSAGYSAGVAGAVHAALSARYSTSGLVSARDVIDTLMATVTPTPQTGLTNWSVTNGVINAEAAVDRVRLGKAFQDVQTVSIGSTTYAFALGQDATLYYSKQTTAGGAFSAWTAVPNSAGTSSFSAVAVGTTPYLAIRSLNNKVYANALTGPSTNTWAGWNEVNNSLGSDRVYLYVDPAGIMLYVTGQNGGSVYYNKLTTFAGTTWNLVPGSLGTTDLRVVPYNTNSGSYQHILAVQPTGNGKALYNAILTGPTTNTWTTWTQVAGSTGMVSMDAAPTNSNTTIVVIASANGHAYMNSLTYSNLAGSGWSLVPGSTGDVRSVSAFAKANGRVGIGFVTAKGYSYENSFLVGGTWESTGSSTLAQYLAGIQDTYEYVYNGSSDARIYRTWGGQLFQIASNKTRLLPQLT